MAALNIVRKSRVFRLGLVVAFGLVLVAGLMLLLGAAQPVYSSTEPSTEASTVVSSGVQEDAPRIVPVITHTATQQWVGISGDCVVFRDDRDDHWNVYLHKLSTGETITVTTNEPPVTADSLRKVVISQGVVVWRSERPGQEGLWGYYDPTCSDAGPFTRTEVIEEFPIIFRSNAHSPALSGEMLAFVSVPR